MFFLSMWLLSMPLQAKESLKFSLGQYRIADSAGSYWYTPVGLYYSSGTYKAKLSLPYISGFNGRDGMGNASVKFSYLSQWKKLYLDFHLKQKLATADSNLTLPVKDTGASIELSGYLWGGVAFMELGHWWRENYQYDSDNQDGNGETENQDQVDLVRQREDSFYYVLGGVYPIKKGWVSGLLLDYKPTALGNLDRTVSVLLQYKLNARHKITATLGKGLSDTSPDWVSGLVWKITY